MKMKDSRYY